MSRRARRARRGLFVVLEGLDGAGTTTQLGRLADALRGQGRAVLTTSEPSTGPIGMLIRQALKGRAVQPDGAHLSHDTLALLFAADRVDHLHSEILPALEEGTVVLCDRYVLSSLAYQGANVPMAWVAELNARAPAPDLTLFLDVNLRTAAARRARRGGAPEIYEQDDHQRRTAAQYRRAISSRRDRVVHLDGHLAPEAITARALELIAAEL
jgi:dTMP kinase